MQQSPGREILGQIAPSQTAPVLLITAASAHRVFLGNLWDTFFWREPAPPRATSPPAEFWPDVFVYRPVAWRSMGRSALCHTLALLLIWTLSPRLTERARVRAHSPFDNSRITYYSVSEYLPEISTGTAPAQPKRERRGQPRYARQPIISVPASPDNFRQTIVTPDQIKLPSDIPMPNVVAWTPVPTPVPEAALTHQLTAPSMAVPVIAPPPDTSRLANAKLPPAPAPEVVSPPAATESLRSRLAPSMASPDVVSPAPSTEDARSRVRLPNVPEPSVIEPPVSASAVRRPLGEMNVDRLDSTVVQPKLPVREQAAYKASEGAGAAGSGSPPAAAPAPPPPDVVAGLGNGKRATGQLIALGLDPAAVNGAIHVPAGSRHGEFAATPEGKPDAPGTPDIKASNTTNVEHRVGNDGRAGAGSGALSGPAGISVGRGPSNKTTDVVVQGNPAAAPAGREVKPTLMAALGPSRVADIGRANRPSTSVTAPAKIEDQVFGARHYYSMMLNMPNLTSAGGSWIIRFAELADSQDKSELAAPVATIKVDPAYPAELVRDRVEGTVTLYAVIRKDGTVGEVKVLRGVDERLDENARLALSRWKFRPATKHGAAVDLEAVVQIPFVASRLRF
ncbi:MAG: TonB family protein [Terriglobales bacterium]